MKATPGAEYAHYFGEGDAYYPDGHKTPWALLDDVVPELGKEELGDLLVGEIRDCTVDRYIKREDILDLLEFGKFTLDRFLERISEIHGENYDTSVDVEVSLVGSNEDVAAARKEFQRLVDSIPERFCDSWDDLDPDELNFMSKEVSDIAERIVSWAAKNIQLEPAQSCHGVSPLPIELVEGEWHYGREKDEVPAADISIDYVFIYNAEGDGCRWRWTLPDGSTGDCTSLNEAMRVSRAELDASAEPSGTI